jgi:eukaryotic-like serine/threonine-protein kinase
MTPEYASPEQFQGHSITTATDVYSLGLVLYELLTGHPAHRFKSRLPHEIARSVLESEPERPSIDIWRKEGVGKEEAGKVESTLEFVSSRRKDTPDKLRRRLAGDLDNIVMKAIRKEPDQRYASVDQLSEDLRRYLEGLPVQARRSTVGYRCQKYVLRHKVAVAAGALLALSLSTGMVLTLYEAHIAQVNAVRAEKRFNDVRKLANSLLFDIHDRVRDLPGSTEARQAIVRSALEYLDSLSQEAGNDTGLQRELAMAYERVGDVQGNPYYANLGNVSGALANYRKSLAIRQHLLASDSQNVTLQRNLSASYNKIGVALEGLENYSEALASYREAATILERLSKKSTDPMMLDQLAGAYFYVANAARGSGDLKLALESAQRAVSVRQTIQTNVPAQETAVETHSAGDHAGLASIFSAMNDFDSALAERRKSIAIMKSLSQQNPHDPTIQSFLGQGEFGLARTLISMGKTNKALEALGKAKSIFDLLLSLDPVNAFAREQLALIYQTTGYLKAQIGNRIAGLADLKVSIAMLELIETTRTGDALALSDFAVSYDNVGRVYTQISEDAKAPVAARAKNLGEACRAFEQSASKWSELRARGPLNESYQQQFERTKKSLASCNDSLAKLSANARFRELK